MLGSNDVMAEMASEWMMLLPPRHRAWVWCVFALAFPALVSPLLFFPLPFSVPRGALGVFVAVTEYPRCWATSATFVGIIGARKWATSMPQVLTVACLISLAWLLGCDTAEKMRHIF